MDTKIEITTSSILKTVAALSGLVFLWLVKDILAIIFFALVIASALNPIIKRLQQLRFPRTLAAIFVYLAFFGGGILLISLATVPLAQEVNRLSQAIPEITSTLRGLEQFSRLSSELQESLLQLSARLSNVSINLFSITENVVGTAVSVVAVFVISFYLSVENQGIKEFLKDITPKSKKRLVVDLWGKIQYKLGAWFKAELGLTLSVGILTFIGLQLLGFRYALVLGLFAALTEFIPYVGPVIASIPSVLIALTQGLPLTLMTILLYVLVQQTENYVLAPQIMKKAVSLNPLLVIIVLMIGAKLGGFLGLLLAVPITVALVELVREIFNLEGVQLWKKPTPPHKQ